jgi:hypothetical protein
MILAASHSVQSLRRTTTQAFEISRYLQSIAHDLAFGVHRMTRLKAIDSRSLQAAGPRQHLDVPQEGLVDAGQHYVMIPWVVADISIRVYKSAQERQDLILG